MPFEIRGYAVHLLSFTQVPAKAKLELQTADTLWLADLAVAMAFEETSAENPSEDELANTLKGIVDPWITKHSTIRNQPVKWKIDIKKGSESSQEGSIQVGPETWVTSTGGNGNAVAAVLQWDRGGTAEEPWNNASVSAFFHVQDSENSDDIRFGSRTVAVVVQSTEIPPMT